MIELYGNFLVVLHHSIYKLLWLGNSIFSLSALVLPE